MDLAIITALEKELKRVLKLVLELKKETLGSHTFNTGYFRDTNNRQISVVATHSLQMGMIPASVLTMEIINKYRPKYLVMTGIAASFDRALHNYGDILVPEIIWDYGSGKISEDSNHNTVFQFELIKYLCQVILSLNYSDLKMIKIY